MSGKLYLIPTVIAENAQDSIPEQVRAVLTDCEYFLVENVRTARRYISSLKLGVTIEDLHFEVLDKKTSDAEVNRLMQPVFKGLHVGILSESGCPGIADPGSKAVGWAHAHSIEVVPLVGPSSLLLALMASGFNGQKFAFHGYLPVDKKELAKAIRNLEAESSKINQTQVFIETPYRNNQLLNTILSSTHPETKLCICRDVTGSNALVKTKTIREWKNQLPDLHKVPTVFVLYAGK